MTYGMPEKGDRLTIYIYEKQENPPEVTGFSKELRDEFTLSLSRTNINSIDNGCCLSFDVDETLRGIMRETVVPMESSISVRKPDGIHVIALPSGTVKFLAHIILSSNSNASNICWTRDFGKVFVPPKFKLQRDLVYRTYITRYHHSDPERRRILFIATDSPEPDPTMSSLLNEMRQEEQSEDEDWEENQPIQQKSRCRTQPFELKQNSFAFIRKPYDSRREKYEEKEKFFKRRATLDSIFLVTEAPTRQKGEAWAENYLTITIPPKQNCLYASKEPVRLGFWYEGVVKFQSSRQHENNGFHVERFQEKICDPVPTFISRDGRISIEVSLLIADDEIPVEFHDKCPSEGHIPVHNRSSYVRYVAIRSDEFSAYYGKRITCRAKYNRNFKHFYTNWVVEEVIKVQDSTDLQGPRSSEKKILEEEDRDYCEDFNLSVEEDESDEEIENFKAISAVKKNIDDSSRPRRRQEPPMLLDEAPLQNTYPMRYKENESFSNSVNPSHNNTSTSEGTSQRLRFGIPKTELNMSQNSAFSRPMNSASASSVITNLDESFAELNIESNSNVPLDFDPTSTSVPGVIAVTVCLVENFIIAFTVEYGPSIVTPQSYVHIKVDFGMTLKVTMRKLRRPMAGCNYATIQIERIDSFCDFRPVSGHRVLMKTILLTQYNKNVGHLLSLYSKDVEWVISPNKIYNEQICRDIDLTPLLNKEKELVSWIEYCFDSEKFEYLWVARIVESFDSDRNEMDEIEAIKRANKEKEESYNRNSYSSGNENAYGTEKTGSTSKYCPPQCSAEPSHIRNSGSDGSFHQAKSLTDSLSDNNQPTTSNEMESSVRYDQETGMVKVPWDKFLRIWDIDELKYAVKLKDYELLITMEEIARKGREQKMTRQQETDSFRGDQSSCSEFRVQHNYSQRDGSHSRGYY